MPFSLFSHHPSTPPQPTLKIHGPSNKTTFHLTSPSSPNPLATYTFTNKTLTRPPQKLYTFSRSSLSGTVTLHPQKIKIKHSWEGMQYGKEIHFPGGEKLKWRPGKKGVEELRDEKKNLVARGKLGGVFGGRNSDLELFVQDGEKGKELVEVILASWIVMLDLSGEEAGETEAVVEGLVGLVGG